MLNLSTRANLITLYSEPHRYYHTIEHIYNCEAEYQQYCDYYKINKDWNIITAIWYHDAIYNPKSKTNEEDSATLYLNNKPESLNYAIANKIQEMILCSKHHNPTTDEEKIFCDIDMAILGYNEGVYVKYTSDVRKEYSFVSDQIFYAGRMAFINKTIDSKCIFHTEYFNKKYEIKARANLYAERSDLISKITNMDVLQSK